MPYFVNRGTGCLGAVVFSIVVWFIIIAAVRGCISVLKAPARPVHSCDGQGQSIRAMPEYRRPQSA